MSALPPVSPMLSKKSPATYKKESGDTLIFNFAASSVLARQIEEGAPADLIVSADEAKLDTLEKKGLLLPGTRKSILSNTLVIVVPADSTINIKSAERSGRTGYQEDRTGRTRQRPCRHLCEGVPGETRASGRR